MKITTDKEFDELEDMIYKCLYEQEICDIEDCKYFYHCKVCKLYIDLVEKRFPLVK